MNYGIKKGYPRLQRYFGKFTAYIQLCRAFTLIAPFFAGILGVFSCAQVLNFETLKVAVYVSVTLALAQATGQVINQYADVELDRVIKPYRPLPQGAISKEEALGFAWLLAIICIGRAFTISEVFGLVTLTLIFFAVFYSLSPFSPRKINSILNVAWMAFSRGFLPILAVWSLYEDLNRALPYSLLAFLWVFGFQSTKDVDDVEGDKKFGIKTIPIKYGVKGVRTLMIICGTAYTLLAIQFQLYLMLTLIPIAIMSTVGATKRSNITENTYGWIGFYLGLASFFIFMFLNEKLL